MAYLPVGGDSAYGTSSTARNALATVLALLPEGLLCRAVAAHHALRPLHLMPIRLLLMTQVTGKAAPTAGEPKPPDQMTGELGAIDCARQAKQRTNKGNGNAMGSPIEEV